MGRQRPARSDRSSIDPTARVGCWRIVPERQRGSRRGGAL